MRNNFVFCCCKHADDVYVNLHAETCSAFKPLEIIKTCGGLGCSKNRMERNLVVLYGSQTGTAQDLAERVGREALR